MSLENDEPNSRLPQPFNVYSEHHLTEPSLPHSLYLSRSGAINPPDWRTDILFETVGNSSMRRRKWVKTCAVSKNQNQNRTKKILINSKKAKKRKVQKSQRTEKID